VIRSQLFSPSEEVPACWRQAGAALARRPAEQRPPIALAYQGSLQSRVAAEFSRRGNLPQLCKHLKLFDYIYLVAVKRISRVKTISIKIEHTLPMPKAIAGNHSGRADTAELSNP
jgi:hypothetical protein